MESEATPNSPERKRLGSGDFVTAYSFWSGSEGEPGREMVVKEYDPSKLEDLTGHATLPEALAKLRHRREFTRRYYDELPNLVLDGDLFIGETADGYDTIFDEQAMTHAPAVASDAGREAIAKLGESQRAAFQEEVRNFLQKTWELADARATLDPEDAEFLGAMFDMGDENLRVTEDGHLLVIDTNVYLPLLGWEDGPAAYHFEGQIRDFAASVGIQFNPQG